MIKRDLIDILQKKLFSGKVIVLIGPRQVGKTTILNILSEQYKNSNNPLFLNCDEPDIRSLLSDANSVRLKSVVGKSNFLIIDEAQRIENIGLTLKLLHDSNTDLPIIVSGSSSLDLSNSINEPLTGRKYEYHLFPFSFGELVADSNLLEQSRALESRLIYGFYPDVVNNPSEQRELLQNITQSYLYKDIFNFKEVRKPAIIEKLVQALALQIGSEVSFHELSNLLGIDSQTVERYIDLLEKAYIIFHLHSYSKNVRNELKKSIKIYFYDNGIRNSVISNFNPLNLRSDVGSLWENFLISERIKHNTYHNISAQYYFWRTTQKQEVDFIEIKDNQMFAFEFKYNPNKSNTKCPKTFSDNYPESDFCVITSDNYFDFVMPQN